MAGPVQRREVEEVRHIYVNTARVEKVQAERLVLLRSDVQEAGTVLILVVEVNVAFVRHGRQHRVVSGLSGPVHRHKAKLVGSTEPVCDVFLSVVATHLKIRTHADLVRIRVLKEDFEAAGLVL